MQVMAGCNKPMDFYLFILVLQNLEMLKEKKNLTTIWPINSSFIHYNFWLID